jgi:hypothetical protein
VCSAVRDCEVPGLGEENSVNRGNECSVGVCIV